MGLLADWQIRKLALEQAMITPFVDHQVRNGNISYGLSSYGYDIRVDNKFKVMYPPAKCCHAEKLYEEVIIDPKGINPNFFTDIEVSTCLIPPNSYVLAQSVETFDMPENITGVCVGKSTYVRCGIHILMSPLEANWRGILTLEIANLTPYPAKIYAGEGIAQILFFEGDAECVTSYADRDGKYQNQTGIVLPKV